MLGALTRTGEGRIDLTLQDINILNHYKLVGGTITRGPNEAFLLVVLISRNGKVRAEGLPRNRPWEGKKCYYIEILPQQLRRIAKGKTVTLEQPNISLRKIFLCREDVI